MSTVSSSHTMKILSLSPTGDRSLSRMIFIQKHRTWCTRSSRSDEAAFFPNNDSDLYLLPHSSLAQFTWTNVSENHGKKTDVSNVNAWSLSELSCCWTCKYITIRCLRKWKECRTSSKILRNQFLFSDGNCLSDFCSLPSQTYCNKICKTVKN